MIYDYAIRCDDCGQFMDPNKPGASQAEIYDMVHMCLDREHLRCARCSARLGPVQSNARPADGDMSKYQWIAP